MTAPKKAAIPFFILGIAFLALGIAGQRTFLFVAVPFLILAAVLARRGRVS